MTAMTFVPWQGWGPAGLTIGVCIARKSLLLRRDCMVPKSPPEYADWHFDQCVMPSKMWRNEPRPGPPMMTSQPTTGSAWKSERSGLSAAHELGLGQERAWRASSRTVDDGGGVRIDSTRLTRANRSHGSFGSPQRILQRRWRCTASQQRRPLGLVAGLSRLACHSFNTLCKGSSSSAIDICRSRCRSTVLRQPVNEPLQNGNEGERRPARSVARSQRGLLDSLGVHNHAVALRAGEIGDDGLLLRGLCGAAW